MASGLGDSALLASFVPGAVLAELSARGPLQAAKAEPFEGVVLITDLSGFSRLASELSREADGMEKLTALLNDGFSTLIDIIQRYGGDVLKFAGDALIVVWRAGAGGQLAEPAHLAVACAVECNAAFETDATPFAIHCAVAAGPVFGVFCGGRAGRWEYLVAGAAVMDDLSRGLDTARAGQVLVTAHVAGLVGDRATCGPVAPDLSLVNHCDAPAFPAPALPRIPDETNDLAAFVPAIVLARFDAGQTEWLSERRVCSTVFVSLPITFASPESLAELQTAVLAIQDQLVHLQGTLRQVVQDDKGTVCICVFGLPPLVHADDPTRAVTAALRITAALAGSKAGITTGRAFCGTVGSSSRREYALVSSLVNLAARFMGVARPGGVLCDKATRDVASARVDFDDLAPMVLKGWSEPVPVYAAVVPTDSGVTPGGLGMARRGSRASFGTPRRGSRASFGTPRQQSRASMGSVPALLADKCIGRAKEKKILESAIAKLAAKESALASRGLLAPSQGPMQVGGLGAIVIEGEAGIGKSTLVHAAVRFAEEASVPIIHAAADGFEESTPYYCFRDILASLVRFDDFDSDVERRAVVETLLSKRVMMRMDLGSRRSFNENSRPVSAGVSRASSTIHVEDVSDPARFRRAAPLLNALLPFGFAETDHSRAIQGKGRADLLQGMLVQIAMAATLTGASKTLLVIEDGHWMDSASLKTLVQICRHCPRIMVLLTMRPDTRDAMQEGLLRLAQVRTMRLAPLDAVETAELVCAKLGATRVPDRFLELIKERSAGHPFYATEIALFCRDAGVIEVDKTGDAVITDGVDLRTISIPSTVEGVVMQRLGQLDSRVQLALKVASVIGRGFHRTVLESIHPIDGDRSRIPGLLKEATQHELVDPDKDALPGLAYLFRNTTTHTVSYDLLVAEQRRALHVKVAEYHLERATSDDALARTAPLLAFHFQRGGEQERALRFLILAGREAHRQDSHSETIAFLGEALALIEADAVLRAPYGDVEIGEFHKLLGDARMDLGDAPGSYAHLRRALALFGRPYPRTTPAALWQMIRALWRQRAHYKRKRYRQTRTALSADENKALLLAAECYDRLSQMAYFKGDTLGMLFTLVVSLNISEECNTQDNAILASNYLMAGMVFPMVGKAALADQYFGFGWHCIDENATSPAIIKATTNLELLSGVHHCNLGRLRESLPHLERGIEAGLEFGDGRRLEENLSVMSDALFLSGIPGADAPLSLLQSAMQRGDPQASLWGCNNLMLGHARYGADFVDEDRIAELDERMAALTKELGDDIQKLDQLCYLGSQAIVHQDVDLARKALAVLKKYEPSAFGIAGFAFATAVVFLRAARGVDGRATSRLLADCRATLKAIKPHRAVFPVIDAIFLRADGYYAALSGRPDAAVGAFRAAVDRARALDMSFDVLAAALELQRLFGEETKGLDFEEAARDVGVSMGRLEEQAILF